MISFYARTARQKTGGRGILALLFLLIFITPAVHATRTTCELALLALQNSLGDAPKTERYDDSVRHEKDPGPTVEVTEHLPGLHGGERLLITRTGARWASDHRSVEYDPQGDPRWFIEVIGSDAAEFFGFKILSNTQVVVPDGREFNGALDKINAELRATGKEPVEITFYVTPGEDNTKVAEYVRRFGRDGGLPLASSGNHLFHDLSFHTGAIFIPGDLVRLGKFFAAFLDGYLNFLVQKYARDSRKLSAAKIIAHMLRMNHTIAIDTASGVVNPGIVGVLRKPGLHEALMMLYAPSVIMSGQGKTAVSYFTDKLYALEPGSGKFLTEYGEMTNFMKAVAAIKVLTPAQLTRDLQEFEARKTTPDHDKFATRYFPQIDAVMESLCKGYGQRRLTVRQAALALLGRN